MPDIHEYFREDIFDPMSVPALLGEEVFPELRLHGVPEHRDGTPAVLLPVMMLVSHIFSDYYRNFGFLAKP